MNYLGVFSCTICILPIVLLLSTLRVDMSYLDMGATIMLVAVWAGCLVAQMILGGD